MIDTSQEDSVIPATGNRRAKAAFELFGSGNAADVLARIVPGDPLGLRVAVAGRMRERALLLDVDRATVRALALVAARGVRYRGRPRLDLWLAGRIEEVIDGLLAEESDGQQETAAEVRALSARLGLSPAVVIRGRARFHALDFDVRDAFVRLVLEAHSIDETAVTLGLSVTELARRARHGLLAFLGEEVRP